MITYPMTNRDAMRTIMARVPAAQVQFVDPVLQMFFDDEAAGLCDIEVKRLGPVVPPEGHQHHVIVNYLDPELEMIKTLSI